MIGRAAIVLLAIAGCAPETPDEPLHPEPQIPPDPTP